MCDLKNGAAGPSQRSQTRDSSLLQGPALVEKSVKQAASQGPGKVRRTWACSEEKKQAAEGGRQGGTGSHFLCSSPPEECGDTPWPAPSAVSSSTHFRGPTRT